MASELSGAQRLLGTSAIDPPSSGRPSVPLRCTSVARTTAAVRLDERRIESTWCLDCAQPRARARTGPGGGTVQPAARPTLARAPRWRVVEGVTHPTCQRLERSRPRSGCGTEGLPTQVLWVPRIGGAQVIWASFGRNQVLWSPFGGYQVIWFYQVIWVTLWPKVAQVICPPAIGAPGNLVHIL